MWVEEIEIFASPNWQGKGKNLSKEEFFQINKKIVYTLDIFDNRFYSRKPKSAVFILMQNPLWNPVPWAQEDA